MAGAIAVVVAQVLTKPDQELEAMKKLFARPIPKCYVMQKLSVKTVQASPSGSEN